MSPSPEISYSLVLRLIRRRFGDVPVSIQEKISSLDDSKLDEFSEELLSFESINELEDWLNGM